MDDKEHEEMFDSTQIYFEKIEQSDPKDSEESASWILLGGDVLARVRKARRINSELEQMLEIERVGKEIEEAIKIMHIIGEKELKKKGESLDSIETYSGDERLLKITILINEKEAGMEVPLTHQQELKKEKAYQDVMEEYFAFMHDWLYNRLIRAIAEAMRGESSPRQQKQGSEMVQEETRKLVQKSAAEDIQIIVNELQKIYLTEQTPKLKYIKKSCELKLLIKEIEKLFRKISRSKDFKNEKETHEEVQEYPHKKKKSQDGVVEYNAEYEQNLEADRLRSKIEEARREDIAPRQDEQSNKMVQEETQKPVQKSVFEVIKITEIYEIKLVSQKPNISENEFLIEKAKREQNENLSCKPFCEQNLKNDKETQEVVIEYPQHQHFNHLIHFFVRTSKNVTSEQLKDVECEFPQKLDIHNEV